MIELKNQYSRGNHLQYQVTFESPLLKQFFPSQLL